MSPLLLFRRLVTQSCLNESDAGGCLYSLSAGGLEGIRKGWEVGGGTGRGSYGNCSRPGTKGRERKRLPKAWELEQC